jgi:DNA primase
MPAASLSLIALLAPASRSFVLAALRALHLDSSATRSAVSPCCKAADLWRCDMETKTISRSDRLKAAHDKLQAAVEQISSGDDWKRMLKVVSKFHRYSFNNHLMIFLQRPDATVVAGFNKWKSLGRFVKKGEKGIAIFAPCKYKTTIEDENGDEQNLQQVRGFRIVYVFDISQTEGEELPDLEAVRPKLLDGDAPDGIWNALVGQADSIDFEVIRDRRGSENGYCDFLKRRIGVRPDVSPAQAVKTLIHELGHALLHSEGPILSREVAEVEVESVAFVVCDALGLDSGDYSFPYVTRWAEGDTDLLKETAQRATECASGILVRVEGADGSAV